MDYVIAAFDIGKTNKKIILFDENLKVLTSSYSSFPTLKRGNLEVEDIEGIEQWIINSLSAYSGEYPIKVISISTHGAAFVGTGENGRPSLPVVSYTNEPGNSFHDEFYKLAGKPEELQIITATPGFGALLNIAKGIYFLKKTLPCSFAKTRSLLFYPQYFGYFLTGEIAADYTYAGCHSYLWDFHKRQWSEVAEKLEILKKLPTMVVKPSAVLGRLRPGIVSETGLSKDTIVTAGIHDSNASLLPYIIKQKQRGDFVLNSTGTWCVVMHPMDEVYFSEEELGKVVFYNLSALGQPVKTAIFTGGLEHDAYMKIVQDINNTKNLPPYDKEAYQKVMEEKRLFILPGILKGSGQFPDSKPRVYENKRCIPYPDIESGRTLPEFFKDPVTARAVLNISLAVQTEIAFKRAGIQKDTAVYTEGGFRKNSGYNLLVSSAFPGSCMFLSDIKEAAAFGAALTGKAAYEKKELEETENSFEIETQPVEKAHFPGMDSYRDAFLELTARES
ncbi:MAG: carbohydrate kinase [Spirochaetes bacterium]|nr:carbohydrate kinase [Spirochaetota bacterium]